jgi:hypothetical protein
MNADEDKHSIGVYLRSSAARNVSWFDPMCAHHDSRTSEVLRLISAGLRHSYFLTDT